MSSPGTNTATTSSRRRSSSTPTARRRASSCDRKKRHRIGTDGSVLFWQESSGTTDPDQTTGLTVDVFEAPYTTDSATLTSTAKKLTTFSNATRNANSITFNGIYAWPGPGALTTYVVRANGTFTTLPSDGKNYSRNPRLRLRQRILVNRVQAPKWPPRRGVHQDSTRLLVIRKHVALLCSVAALGCSTDPNQRDAATDAVSDTPNGKVCDCLQRGFVCVDGMHWQTVTAVFCPSPQCPAQCASGRRGNPNAI